MTLIPVLVFSADETQFYFVAKNAQGNVYLRWGVVEGTFPNADEIDRIVLKRNDENLSSFSPVEIMSESEIDQLYRQPENQPALKRIIAMIDKNSEGACQGANLGNYPAVLHTCMQESMWRYVAAKTEFTIAMVEHRAYIDRNPPAGEVTYELIAVKESGGLTRTSRLGKVTIDTTAQTTVLPAKNFKQVRQSTACNAPEYAKDDYTVSLTWQNGGTQTDAFANSMMIAGYDLYRDRADGLSSPSVQDIETLRGSVTVDADGNYQFPTIEKVNETPILLANGENEETPLYMETKDQLKKAGMAPGKSRWYYLVPRDFTGAYGPTVSYKVTVPNLLPPVTPWGVRAIEHEKKAKLVWENITPASYAAHYKRSRKFCNTDTLGENKRLRFVDKDGICGQKEMEVNLNIDKYYVYRFDTPAAAAKFSDSDLDGIGDLDETDEKVCVADGIHMGTLVKIIDAHDYMQEPFVSFVDDNVSLNRYYWYRIASVSDAGQQPVGSVLTPPIRAMVPDRTLPDKPNPTMKVCDSNYIVKAYSIQGEMPYIAYDETGEAKEVRITCMADNLLSTYVSTSQQSIYLPVGDDGYVEANGFNPCECSKGEIAFLDERRNVLASKALCSGCTVATEFYVLEAYDCSYNGLKELKEGVDYYAWPVVDLEGPVADDECVEFTMIIADKRIRIKRDCQQKQHFDLSELNLSNLGKGEKFCLGIDVYNADNQHSPISYLPCFGVIDTQAPGKPDVRKVQINDDNITVSWISPQEKIAATMISLYNEENRSQSYLRTYTHPDHMEKDANQSEMSLGIDISMTDQNRIQKWCAKAKSIGFNGKRSEWSAPRCNQNLPEEERTEYLPWPAIPSVNGMNTLHFTYAPDEYAQGRLMSEMAHLDITIPSLNLDVIKSWLERAFLSVPLHFAMYRQEKDTNNNWSRFVQVSPYVENLHIIGERISGEATEDKPAYIVFEMEDDLVMIFRFVISKGVYTSASSTTTQCIGQAVLYYEDKYPHKKDTDYRYVKVLFDDTYEVTGYEVSNVVRSGIVPGITVPNTIVNSDPQVYPAFQTLDFTISQPELQIQKSDPNSILGGVQ
jgi:hypothetical protein